ncbi:hypothetical protein HanXRQr2_Chr07g0303801 [Helianthus annuus]|uniref:Uncharacterized protein n=1 Tax=Helianthus annuus TaxID=4232 RepID=A0A9K3NGC6_HELAN|nr:hypothetical protein HanXRQr2_Chr07g0303801 [Helianthus annuus]KAJ0905444.1 hypothetical protein HanPSC8_Chr07g0294081 [Helianthus annuus]
MYHPAPILTPLQPNMFKRLIRIINQNLILILRPPYRRYMKRNFRLRCPNRHFHRRRRRTTQLITTTYIITISIINHHPFLLPTLNQLKPIISSNIIHNPNTCFLFLIPQTPKLINRSIKPLKQLIIKPNQPIIHIIIIIKIITSWKLYLLFTPFC